MKKIIYLFSLVLSSFTAFSQEDAQGCKDHPLFNRLPHFWIIECTENFAALDVYVGPEKKQNVEGTRTFISYLFNGEDGKYKNPSWLQVTRNYEAAILKAGGKKIFSNNEYATFKFTKDGKENYVMLTFNSGTDLSVEQFYLDVVEMEAMKQDIEATAMFKELNTSGHIALYINFETGKSTIKPESQPIIDQIVQLLKTNPDLKINIEGHTDNVGTPASNKTLSEARAKAVMNAVVAKGIPAARMVAKGMGQDKPIAENTTEDGRAKNRRVEIVKQ